MRIFLDMDGVLADFNAQTKRLNIPHNTQWFDPKDTWTPETWAGEKVKTDAMHKAGFWNTIPKMLGAQELWDFCAQYKPFVLTCQPQVDSPPLVGKEKYQWLNEQLGPIPLYRFICVNHGDKKKFVKNGSVLVDDDKRHFEGFEPGAIGILYTDAASAIATLKQVIKNAK